MKDETAIRYLVTDPSLLDADRSGMKREGGQCDRQGWLSDSLFMVGIPVDFLKSMARIIVSRATSSHMSQHVKHRELT